MAFWKKNKTKYEEMDIVIENNQGISQAELARQLGEHRSTTARRLATAQEAGYLYWEDDEGRIWSFKNN